MKGVNMATVGYVADKDLPNPRQRVWVSSQGS